MTLFTIILSAVGATLAIAGFSMFMSRMIVMSMTVDEMNEKITRIENALRKNETP